MKETATAEYELYYENDVMARLRWVKAQGSMAMGEAAGARWSFKRVGFFATRISVRYEGSDADLALFTANWKGDGSVTVTGNGDFAWKSTSFWKANYALTDKAGNVVLSIIHDDCVSPDVAKLTLGSGAVNTTIGTLLACLAMYVGLLAIEDGEEAGAVAVLMASIG